MLDFLNGWGLTLVIFLPAVAALAVMVTPAKNEENVKIVGLVGALATLGMGILTVSYFNFDKAAVGQFDVNRTWIDTINSNRRMNAGRWEYPRMYGDNGWYAFVPAPYAENADELYALRNNITLVRRRLEAVP